MIRKSIRLMVCAVAVVVFLTEGTTRIWAQATAQIGGSVKDQTGAVLPGVEVTATQTATGAKRNAVTDEAGSYILQNLPIGPYTLEATLPGFKTYVQSGNVVLSSGRSADGVAREVARLIRKRFGLDIAVAVDSTCSRM